MLPLAQCQELLSILTHIKVDARQWCAHLVNKIKSIKIEPILLLLQKTRVSEALKKIVKSWAALAVADNDSNYRKSD